MKCFCTELEEGPLYADELEEGQWASLMVQTVKNLPAVRGTQAQSLGQEDPLGKVMGTQLQYSRWRIPWTVEPGWLVSMGSQRVGHD